MARSISKNKRILLSLLLLIAIGMVLPQPTLMPVAGAKSNDFHPESFWYYPWGKSITHKGVDIFAQKGTELFSATYGLVLYAGKIKMGGNVVVVLGPKWRVHYYAHLEAVTTKTGSLVTTGATIGTVGDSGNAKGKAPHLHYSIATLVPYPWRIDGSKQGWKKMFYLNPIDYIQE